LKRRAQSYTDFHHTVRAILGQDAISNGKNVKEAKNEEATLQIDLGSADWYFGSEQELLESSHDEYTYVDRDVS